MKNCKVWWETGQDEYGIFYIVWLRLEYGRLMTTQELAYETDRDVYIAELVSYGAINLGEIQNEK